MGGEGGREGGRERGKEGGSERERESQRDRRGMRGRQGAGGRKRDLLQLRGEREEELELIYFGHLQCFRYGCQGLEESISLFKSLFFTCAMFHLYFNMSATLSWPVGEH